MNSRKPRLTQKYRLALEMAELHNIYPSDRNDLYKKLQQQYFTWFPGLRQWLPIDRYYKKEWGTLPAFTDRDDAQADGLFTIQGLHERGLTHKKSIPDAVLRCSTYRIDELWHISNTRKNLYNHSEYGELQCFRFWDHIPEHLRTKTQIRQTDKKRRPNQQPKALVDTCYVNHRGYERGGVYLLYDINECLDKKPQTEAQKKAFQKVRKEHSCKDCGMIGIQPSEEGLCPYCQKWRDKERAFDAMLVQKRNEAIQWAQGLFEKGFVVLDTETTGLYGDVRIVEIAVIDGGSGDTLFDSLVNPGVPVPAEVSVIHGIYDKDVEGKPTFQEIRTTIENVLRDKICVIYNKAYDKPLLNSHGINTKAYHFDCAMEMYAQFYGDWSEYRGQFKWQNLSAAANQCHLSVPRHRALGDCQVTRGLILYMAQPRHLATSGQNT